MKTRLGVLALGQTPRDDVLPTLRSILGPSADVVERGGLDGLDADGLRPFLARSGETPLETRLRGGVPIDLSKELILPRLIEAARGLSAECGTVLLLCSGEFPALAAACPFIVEPIRVLRGAVNAVAFRRRLGLIGPASDLAEAPTQWRPYAPDLICAAASPYGPAADLVSASRSLATSGAEVLYLDDMGFTEDQRRAAARESGLPSLCATTLVARFLSEYLASESP